MRKAISDHLRDFVALLFLFVIALGVGGYILSNQRFNPPAWVPLVGTGVLRAGGRAVDRPGGRAGPGPDGEHRRASRWATSARCASRTAAPWWRCTSTRARAGLQGRHDPAAAEDRPQGHVPGAGPGHQARRGDGGGRAHPVSNTLPDVNPDEVLAQLDGDTRAYLRVLLNSGAEALSGEGSADLRETFKRFEPTARDAERITRLLAQRRGNIKRVIHNFQELATELGTKDRQLAELVDSANANFEAIANQDVAACAQALRRAAGHARPDARRRSPASSGCPGSSARRCPSCARARARSARRCARRGPSCAPPRRSIRDQIRPFARDVQPTVRDLRRTAERPRGGHPAPHRHLPGAEHLLDTLAHNPRGSEEGYLFWLSWLNHAGASIFGPVRRPRGRASRPGAGELPGAEHAQSGRAPEQPAARRNHRR